VLKEQNMVTCKICLEDKDEYTIVMLQHINSVGDVSGHQMCNDCYKIKTTNKCPFCRCKILSNQTYYIDLRCCLRRIMKN